MSEGSLRIAHLGSKGIPSKGGTERVVEAVARRQAAAGHRVTVYGSRLVCGSGWVAGVRVLALPTVAHKYLGPVLLQLAGAAHALARGGYDVVHLHGAENGFVVPLLRLRYPVVTTNHGPAYLRGKWEVVAKALIRAADGLSVRPATRRDRGLGRQAAELYAPVRPRGGRDPQRGRPRRAGGRGGGRAAAHGARPASRRVPAVRGRARGPDQGLPHAPSRPSAGCRSRRRSLVVGDLFHAPGYEERLRTLARGLPVTFVPRLDAKPVVLGLLRGARLFVFPSEVEAMSMMLLEALCQGTPMLASDIPENTSILPPRFPVFRTGDADALAAALRELLEADAETRRDAAAAARAGWPPATAGTRSRGATRRSTVRRVAARAAL